MHGRSAQRALARRHADRGRYREAIEVASRLIRDIGYEPVLIGGLEKGKYLMPGTPLAGERTPWEIRKIAAGLK